MQDKGPEIVVSELQTDAEHKGGNVDRDLKSIKSRGPLACGKVRLCVGALVASHIGFEHCSGNVNRAEGISWLMRGSAPSAHNFRC